MDCRAYSVSFDYADKQVLVYCSSLFIGVTAKGAVIPVHVDTNRMPVKHAHTHTQTHTHTYIYIHTYIYVEKQVYLQILVLIALLLIHCESQ